MYNAGSDAALTVAIVNMDQLMSWNPLYIKFEVHNFIKDRPYFEAEVNVYIDEHVSDPDSEVQALFAELKQLSRELLALIRLSSLLPRAPPSALSPLLARRLELFIVRKKTNFL